MTLILEKTRVDAVWKPEIMQMQGSQTAFLSLWTPVQSTLKIKWTRQDLADIFFNNTLNVSTICGNM